MSISHKHIFSILLANEPGVLTRVSGLFSARGYNIQSLTVSPTSDESLSRMTILTVGNDKVARQIVNQLHKLVDVIEVSDLAGEKRVEREMLLAKIAHDNSEESRRSLDALLSEHGAELIECLDTFCVIQMMAIDSKIDYFIKAAEANRNVLEIVRSGVITLGRSEQILGDKR